MNYNELKKMARNKGMANVNKATAGEMREFLSAKKPKAAAKPTKVVKTKKVKGDTNIEEEKPKTNAGWIRQLHDDGKSYGEIKEITGLTEGHYVSDVLWRIKNKK